MSDRPHHSRLVQVDYLAEHERLLGREVSSISADFTFEALDLHEACSDQLFKSGSHRGSIVATLGSFARDYGMSWPDGLLCYRQDPYLDGRQQNGL